jgi:hypothetical protein
MDPSHERSLLVPLRGLFIGMGNPAEEGFLQMSADKLKTDGQSLGGKSAGKGNSGASGKVVRGGKPKER